MASQPTAYPYRISSFQHTFTSRMLHDSCTTGRPVAACARSKGRSSEPVLRAQAGVLKGVQKRGCFPTRNEMPDVVVRYARALPGWRKRYGCGTTATFCRGPITRSTASTSVRSGQRDGARFFEGISSWASDVYMAHVLNPLRVVAGSRSRFHWAKWPEGEPPRKFDIGSRGN